MKQYRITKLEGHERYRIEYRNWRGAWKPYYFVSYGWEDTDYYPAEYGNFNDANAGLAIIHYDAARKNPRLWKEISE